MRESSQPLNNGIPLFPAFARTGMTNKDQIYW